MSAYNHRYLPALADHQLSAFLPRTSKSEHGVIRWNSWKSLWAEGTLAQKFIYETENDSLHRFHALEAGILYLRKDMPRCLAQRSNQPGKAYIRMAKYICRSAKMGLFSTIDNSKAYLTSCKGIHGDSVINWSLENVRGDVNTMEGIKNGPLFTMEELR